MITLRPARIEDAPLLRHWDGQPHVVASDPNDDWRWEEELDESPPGREQFMAELDGRPIGFLQILDPARDPHRYWGEMPSGFRAIDIWIGEAAELGKGHGTEMMRLALARCFTEPDVHAILIDPIAGNVRAHRFYERLGFRFLERRRFGLDDCHVYRLDREDWLRCA